MTAPDYDRLRTTVDGMRFPCEHSDLLRQAAAAGADDDTLGQLSALPRRRYDTAEAVEAACTEGKPR
ncbi:DUF2795 domain-containing protein [Amycolatopsis pithecellobii]|uniref:DUF2795 domain-containing protein n=1 Tax=Amycolatopsis pithecellobii TaxID=664692 RepID=A0A6N7Z3B2_9PSEU|nr:DUF2795 domain-containing protein [Amycolatopsis pithecellobii]MTD53376.1 DUF2795 domain-containing protein [Amycolatopsis pithecellobii]